MASSGLRGQNMQFMLARTRDPLAESLETRGLWLRAAKRWSEVFDACNDDDLRDLYVQRREHCISRANEICRARNGSSEKQDFILVKKAVQEFYQKTNLGPVSRWYIDWS